MRKHIELGVLALLLLLGTSAGQTRTARTGTTKVLGPGGVQQALIAREEGFWDARKNKRADFFEQTLTDESITVSLTGTQNKVQVLEEVAKPECTLKDYSLRDFKSTILATNTFLLTYAAEQRLTCGGKDLPPKITVSSIYVERRGGLRRVFHQETAAPQ